MADVAAALQDTVDMGVHPSSALKLLQPKQDLLQCLLANEQTRLLVWLFPRDHGERHHLIKFGQKSRGPLEVKNSFKTDIKSHAYCGRSPSLLYLQQRGQKTLPSLSICLHVFHHQYSKLIYACCCAMLLRRRSMNLGRCMYYSETLCTRTSLPN